MNKMIGKTAHWLLGSGPSATELKGTIVDQWGDKLTVEVTHVRFKDYGGSFIQGGRRWFKLTPKKEIFLDTDDLETL